MADPKRAEEDDLAIPPFLDRRKPEPKPDRKVAMQKLGSEPNKFVELRIA